MSIIAEKAVVGLNTWVSLKDVEIRGLSWDPHLQVRQKLTLTNQDRSGHYQRHETTFSRHVLFPGSDCAGSARCIRLKSRFDICEQQDINRGPQAS